MNHENAMPAKIEASTMADLCAKVYEREGWARARGESRLRRIKEWYDLGIDHPRNRFIATRKK